MDKMLVATVSAPHMPSRQVSMDSSHYWGTWEKLLLASAVKRHGTDEWGLVSAELQARTMPHSASPARFTPEACRSEYYTLKGRYSRDEDRGGDLSNDVPWFEELRKLRMNQLKRELEHYDNSIGSIESKLKRLKSERDKSLQNGSHQFSERAFDSVANACKAEAERSVRNSDGLTSMRYCQPSGELYLQDRASGVLSSSTRQVTEYTIEGERKGCLNGPEKTESGKLENVQQILCCSVECSKEILVSSNRDRYGDEDAAISRGADSLVVQPDACQEEWRRVPVGDASNLMGMLSRKNLMNGRVYDTAYVEMNCSRGDRSSVRSDSRGESMVGMSNNNAESLIGAGRDGLNSTPGVELMRSLDIRLGDRDREEHFKEEVKNCPSPEDGGSANARDLMSIGRGQLLSKHTQSFRIPVRTSDGSHDGAEALINAPPHKHAKHMGGADASVSLEVGPRKETCVSDSACRVSRDKTISDGMQSMELESEDSTEDNQHEFLPASKKSQSPLYSKEKTRMVKLEAAWKTDSALKISDDHQKLNSRMLVTKLPNSTKKLKLREVWGESAEVGDSKMEQLKHLHKVTGLGRRKLGKSVIPDVVLAGNEEDEATNLGKPVETSVKMESMPASHEDTQRLKEHGGQEANDYDLEEWHQTERFSEDSRVEKSELSTFIDGNDDISPMSRRNKREPKVCGKLSPLLVCFRTISCHKSAPFFKPSQQSQNDPRYDRLIRAHVDLGMIRARLEEGHYFGSVHFFRDLLLMVNNALVYYPRDSQEFLAATGLRECIAKEMSKVLKTEGLRKQKGLSVRKRDFKMGLDAAKEGQSLTGKQGKRKGLKKSPEKPMITSDTDVKLRWQFEVTNVDSCEEISGDRELAVAATEVLVLREDTADSRAVQKSGTDAESSQNEPLKGHKIPDEWKVDKANSAEMRVMDAVQKLKDSGNLVDSRYPLVNSKATLLKAAVSNNGLEIGVLKTPDTPPVPVKRGVGRPPKNSRQHISGKKELAEAPNPRRRWVRR